jgi:predicted RNA-binding Zn-ribbon protein involved in translation (DUF1610 family)
MTSKRAHLHECPFCGARYKMVVTSQRSRSNYHIAVCSICGDVMAQSHGRQSRRYSRIKYKKHPDDSIQIAKHLVADAARKTATRKGRAGAHARQRIKKGKAKKGKARRSA